MLYTNLAKIYWPSTPHVPVNPPCARTHTLSRRDAPVHRAASSWHPAGFYLPVQLFSTHICIDRVNEADRFVVAHVVVLRYTREVLPEVRHRGDQLAQTSRRTALLGSGRIAWDEKNARKTAAAVGGRDPGQCLGRCWESRGVIRQRNTHVESFVVV